MFNQAVKVLGFFLVGFFFEVPWAKEKECFVAEHIDTVADVQNRQREKRTELA